VRSCGSCPPQWGNGGERLRANAASGLHILDSPEARCALLRALDDSGSGETPRGVQDPSFHDHEKPIALGKRDQQRVQPMVLIVIVRWRALGRQAVGRDQPRGRTR